MNENHVYVLIHSPLVGPLTWKLVAQELQRKDLAVIVPTLRDSPDAKEPYWKQHAESVAQSLSHIPESTHLTLVAHSGAGPLLPVIRRSLPHPVHAYLFVDAGLPGAEATRLDLMQSEDTEWAKEFRQHLESGGLFPSWSFDDLQDVIPDESVRAQMVREIQPRALDFFTEPIPVFDGWPDAPGVYILFSEPYKKTAGQAQEFGWSVYGLEAGHFHMLVDPKAVTDLIMTSMNDISSKRP